MKKLMGLRLSPTIGYYAKLAARERLMSVNAFVEQALWNEIQKEEEPDYGTALKRPSPVLPGRFEGLWNDDEATRFYLLGEMRPDLFSPAEARLHKLLTGSIEHAGVKVTLQSFCEAFNHPMVDKTHLQRGEA